MARRALLCVGLQPEKLELLPKKEAIRLLDWVLANQDNYDYTLSLVRKKGNINFESSNQDIDVNNFDTFYDFRVDREIETVGYNAPAGMFCAQDSYDIIGISTGASVLAQAFEFYSAGIDFRVLTDICSDRNGLHKEAVKILNSYMPNCVTRK